MSTVLQMVLCLVELLRWPRCVLTYIDPFHCSQSASLWLGAHSAARHSQQGNTRLRLHVARRDSLVYILWILADVRTCH